MLDALLAGLAVLVASLLAGNAIVSLCGLRQSVRADALAPAAGISALLVVCGICIRLPGRAATAAVVLFLFSLAAAGYLSWMRRRGGTTARGDRGRAWLIAAAATVVGAALITAIPFAASGRVGILGQGLVNDDMASHLLFTEWLSTGRGATPELVVDGYPLGPHALVGAAAKLTGASLVEAFAGFTGALAALLGLTALAALRGRGPWLGAGAALLVAFSYLSAAYLAQGAFKEPLLALALLAFCLSLPLLRARLRDAGSRAAAVAAIPVGLVVAGTIYNYSFPGPAWLAVAAAAWIGMVAIGERGERGGLGLGERIRGALPVTGIVVGVALLASVPEIVNLISFTDFRALNPTGPGDRVGYGNLRQPLSPLQVLGIWPSSEFRIAPENASIPALAFYLGALLGAIAFGIGLRRQRNLREAALPAALIAGAIGYLAAVAVGTPYTQAKGLAVLAPIVMLTSLRGLCRSDPVVDEDGVDSAVGQGRGRILVAALGVAFALAAAFSSFLVLRQAAVGPVSQVEQLIGLRDRVSGKRVLFLGRESFAGWELLGARAYTPIVHNYNVVEVDSLYRATSTRAKFDFDVVPRKVLSRFPLVITTGAAQLSEAPANYSVAARTDDYVLWRRTGPLPPRRTLVETIGPGASVDCSTAAGRRLTSLRGTATVFTRKPVVGQAWEPTPDATEASPSREELRLEPGRWAISLQYASTQAARLSAPGIDVRLAPNLLFRGPAPYFPVGEVTVRRAARLVPFVFTPDPPPTVGRLLGAESRAYLGPLAATPIPARERVPLSESCGRYVDWFELAPGTPATALRGIPQPTRKRVVEP